jgi:hypothetical protein
MGSSSANRPFGHQPPWAIPASIAASRAARSTPVWPPETIFLNRLYRVKGMADDFFTMVAVPIVQEKSAMDVASTGS